MNLYRRPLWNRASNGGARLLLESNECEVVSPKVGHQSVRWSKRELYKRRTYSLDRSRLQCLCRTPAIEPHRYRFVPPYSRASSSPLSGAVKGPLSVRPASVRPFPCSIPTVLVMPSLNRMNSIRPSSCSQRGNKDRASLRAEA